MTMNNRIVLSGLADEAGADLPTQIAVHQELQWDHIELRLVDGKNVAGELPDDAFDRLVEGIEESGLKVTGFASAIGNWSRSITDSFDVDLNELKTAIPRMHRLGVQYIRTMSWLGDGVDEADWKREAIRRYRELAAMAEDGGVFLAHENCTGWGGLTAGHMIQLIEEVGSENVVVLFDIGNTISHGYRAWDFYEGLKDRIRYLHVKDCVSNPEGGRSERFRFPGEGDAQVREILADALSLGYEGVISIEPHIASVVHDSANDPSPTFMRESYLKYARTLEDILRDLGVELSERTGSS
jgi:sugar phosphate isomerase/epimerase